MHSYRCRTVSLSYNRHVWPVCVSLVTAMSTEGLHNKTGVSSVVTIDTILPQPRFYELYDVGTGPLYGNSVQSTGTTAVIEAACSEVTQTFTVVHI